jgi:SAM-dependent methyltransferase
MSHQSWNLLASDFENSVCDITSTSSKLLGELVARARPNRRQTLVDAGCGIGTFVEHFGDRFGKVIAFDFASAMVRRARAPGRAKENATRRSIPMVKAAQRIGTVAHLAVCLNVITSPDAELRQQQWDSLIQLVRPTGRLLLVVPSLESAHYTAEVEAAATDTPPPRRARPHTPHRYPAETLCPRGTPSSADPTGHAGAVAAENSLSLERGRAGEHHLETALGLGLPGRKGEIGGRSSADIAQSKNLAFRASLGLKFPWNRAQSRVSQ